MSGRLIEIVIALAIAAIPATVLAQQPDTERDILVTFENTAVRATTSGTPYRHRKRYAISADARRQAADVAEEYRLKQIDHWPIRSLSVYCFVYRIADGDDRRHIVDQLRADDRVESAQPLNKFETGTAAVTNYDDTYAGLQHGLDTLDLDRAHRYSRGQGVRIAVIDSSADIEHEDLRGRIQRVEEFASSDVSPDRFHGTAVTSVIAARTNNAKGIVGVAPEANVDLYVACWSESDSHTAICDSFTLAKAIDTVLERPPDVLNLSLAGPADGLLQRLLLKAYERNVIVVAARPADQSGAENFPANMDEVIDVGSSKPLEPEADTSIFAPGEQILVAVPDNEYDFRSGSSLAAAHVSGIVALLLAISPDAQFSTVRSLLEQSQLHHDTGHISVNACRVLQLADGSLTCDG